MIIQYLADDIILRLTQGAPTDDSEIERGQLVYLLAQCRDNLVQQYVNKQIANNQAIDTQYKERYLAATMEEEDEATVVADDERLYVTLPKQPLALINDMGVVQVLTQEYLGIDRYRAENFVNYQNLRFAKASPSHICFYRDNLKIIIKGLTRKNKDNDKFIVDYIPSLASQLPAETDDIQLSDALLPQLTEMVETIMKRQMYETVQDLENDGVQEPKQNK